MTRRNTRQYRLELTASDAEAIIAHYIKGKRLSDDVNIKDLAMMMRYQSCAELETILNEAAVRAAFCRQSCIQMKDMVSAVLKQQYDAYEDIPGVSDEVMKYVALHEAGHLVVAETLCPGSVGFVSLLPSEENRCGMRVKPPMAAALTLSRQSVPSAMRLQKKEQWVFPSLILKTIHPVTYPKACSFAVRQPYRSSWNAAMI